MSDEPNDIEDNSDALDIADSTEIKQDEELQTVHTDLNFSFVAYNEDIAICGAKGSGKSYLANTL